MSSDKFSETEHDSLFDQLIEVKHEPLESDTVTNIVLSFLHTDREYVSELGDISIVGHMIPARLLPYGDFSGAIYTITNRELLAVTNCWEDTWCCAYRYHCKVFHRGESQELIIANDDTYESIIDKCAGLEICEGATFATFLTKKVKSARS
jgi:hypothetical protein